MNNSESSRAIYYCPSLIVEKAVKDFSFYKGLEIPVDVINVAPVGLIHLSQPVVVKVLEIEDIHPNNSWYRPSYDVLWKVFLFESSESIVRQEIIKSHDFESHKDEELDPFIPGFTYYVNLENQRIKWYSRGWQKEC